ncbi:MAG: lipid-A-disaccharide synthase [Chitinophagales bacterium]|nr:lipid-A-disaccharide synthase [Chitinophagales bacterium]
MKYFFVTGEISGERHTAQLIHQLKKMDTSPIFYGTGGKAMQDAGVQLVLNIREMAFMGLIEVLKNIFKIRKNFKTVKKSILEIQPDVIVLVDYPGFNLKIAQWAKERGFRVVYYIAPKVWAWKENRVKKLKAYIDLLLVIFPFEEGYFQQRGIPTKFVGNPLVENISEPKEITTDNIIAILPGSRKQEIEKFLPVMLESVYGELNSHQIIVAGISELGEDYYFPIMKGKATLVMDKTQEVLEESKLAIVASGTASLEAALYNVPQVVCYAVHPITYFFAKLFIKVKYISLVNIIMDKMVVPELIQGDFSPQNIKKTAVGVLKDRNIIQYDYLRLRDKMGVGNASKNAATYIYSFLKRGISSVG